MKANFKKISLLTYHRDREKITSVLQELGVLHLEVDPSYSNETVEVLTLKKSKFEKAIDILENITDAKVEPRNAPALKKRVTEQLVDQILALNHQKDALVQEREVLQKNKQKLEPWGNFHSEKLSRLTQAGVEVTFCVTDHNSFNEFDFSELTYQVIHRGPDQTYFVVLSYGEPLNLPFETIQLPTLALAEAKTKLTTLDGKREELNQKIRAFQPYLAPLSKALTQIENDWMLQMVNGSYQAYGEGTILYLSGWYPATMEERLIHYLKQEKLPYTIADPTSGDTVPVLLQNPKYPKLFEPITKIFQLPGYYEMDLTPFIAVFYPILFAYCLGDAGYGLILLLAALVGWFTFLKDGRNIAILGIILGLFTTVMGIVKSGSVFGIPIVDPEVNPFLQYLARFVIIPDDRGVIFNAFNVALMIGVVQILTGIIVSITNQIRYRSFLASLSQIGKLMMVVCLIWIFLADMQGNPYLQPFEPVRKIGLALGILLVLFFHDLKLPVLSRIGSGILPLFFILTGILGDVLSYVRLFALGVASSVLGLVVNQIGMQIMGDAWWSVIVAIIFLILGHSLNFALAALGAFVHPLRLTFVEFYNNAQFEGGGVAYRPFRKNE